MNSSRSRYSHIQPNSPMDILMASTQAGIANMRAKMDQLKEEEKMTQGRCSYCGKEGGPSVNLKSCSRCKYVVASRPLLRVSFGFMRLRISCISVQLS